MGRFLTIRKLVTIVWFLMFLMVALLHFFRPGMLGNPIVKIVIIIGIVGPVIYFFVKDFPLMRRENVKDILIMREDKLHFEDKEERRKRQAVLERDKSFVLNATRNRDLDFLWQKSLEYSEEVCLLDKAEELWRKIKKLDPNGYYGKKAEEKLKPLPNPKSTVEVMDKISNCAERTMKRWNDPQNHIDLADACFDAGDYFAAKGHYEQALSLLKDSTKTSSVRDRLRIVNKELQKDRRRNGIGEDKGSRLPS